MADAPRDYQRFFAALWALVPFYKRKATAPPARRPRSHSAPANVLLNAAPPIRRVAPLGSLPPVSLGPTFDQEAFNVAAFARPAGPHIPAIDGNDRDVDAMFEQLKMDLEQAVARPCIPSRRRVRLSNAKDLARQRLSMPLPIRPTSVAKDDAVEPVQPASGPTRLESDIFADTNAHFLVYQQHLKEALRLLEQGPTEHRGAYLNVALDAMHTALEQGGAANPPADGATSDNITANGARSQAPLQPPRLELSTASLAVSASQQAQSPAVATASHATPSSELRTASSSVYSASINGTPTGAKMPSLNEQGSSTSEDIDSPPATPRSSAASTRVNILPSPPPVPARNSPTTHAASTLHTPSVESAQNNDPPREDSAAVIRFARIGAEQAKNKTSPKANGSKGKGKENAKM